MKRANVFSVSLIICDGGSADGSVTPDRLRECGATALAFASRNEEVCNSMNKLLITGNGFDLANGLPTRYSNFLEYMKCATEYFRNDGTSPIKMYDFLRSSQCKASSYFQPQVSYKVLYHRAKELSDISKDEALAAAYSAYRGYVGDYLHIEENDAHLPDTKSLQDCLRRDKKTAVENDSLLYEYNACLLYVFTHGNLWLDYFVAIEDTMQGHNWIDFENEIAKVIHHIERMILAVQAGESARKLPNCVRIDSVTELLENYNETKPLARSELVGENGLIAVLYSELVILARCFEVYLLLLEQVPSACIRKITTIENLLPFTHLLNFNYTDIFLRHYDNKKKNIPTEFIHGRAGHHTIIIGTQETLDKEHENTMLECSFFKKYFQRIIFKTGLEYKIWLPVEAIRGCETRTYIFGHSLDPTDGEVLRYILLNPNVTRATIFYHTEEAFARQIQNLTIILGKDALVERVGTGKIEFCQSN